MNDSTVPIANGGASTTAGGTPRTSLISLRLTGVSGLFCDDASLAQYNDLVDLCGTLERELNGVIAYIDRFYESGNSVPIDRPWIKAESWKVAKELLAHGLPLEHDLIERECVYRRKLDAYGDETRAVSPLQERLKMQVDRTAPETSTRSAEE